MTPLDLKPEYSAASFRDMVGPLLRCEVEKHVFHTVHRRADQSLYPVEVHLQLVEHEGQRLFLAVILDITERKRAEDALHETQLRLTGLIDAAMDAIITVDRAQTVVQFNGAAQLMFGYLPEQMLGQTLDRLLPEHLRLAHAQHIQDFSQTGVSSRRMGALNRST